MTPAVLAFLAISPLGCTPSASVTADRLATEYRRDPAGIATSKPRLSWKLEATDPGSRGAKLSGYRVIAAATPEKLRDEKDLLWDTGIVKGDGLPTGQIEYGGSPLASRQHVWWKVRLWDERGRDAGWSEPGTFSIGLLEQSDWQAQWIGLDAQPAAPLTEDRRAQLRGLPWIRQPGGPARQARTSYFRGEFELDPGAIKNAYFAGSVDQTGKLSINGKPAANLTRWEMIAPIDVTASLRAGKNVIGIEVTNQDGFNPAATGLLVIEFANGTTREVQLNESFKRSDTAAAGWDQPGAAPSGWQAVEVARGQPWGGNRNIEHFMAPSPFMRATFKPDGRKTVARATLYATALGVYQAHLNGKRIGNDEMTPGWTEYSKRVYHQTYDVTGMMTSGENCLGVTLGDGWYAGLMGYTGKRRYYGNAARFKGQLEIEYTDGSRETLTTGPSWRATFGPILYTDNYLGSSYDARRELTGWDTPGYDASGWAPVELGMAKAKPRIADVTEKVRSLASAGFRVGPDVLGDPCYGVVKTLRVNYTVGGAAKALTFREGESVNFPRPGENGPIVITKAEFGEPPAAASTMVIEPQPGEPVRRFEELAAKKVTELRPGCYVFDMGQNLVGWTRLAVNGKAGQRLTVRHAEMLNPDGTLYTANLRGATQVDFYTLKDGFQKLEPPFTFHGFQYVEVSGLTEKPDASMVTGIVAHTDMTPTGTFTCSEPLVNQLVHNIVWGQKGNYFEVPTDCPQRDERLGWTGDAQFFINAASYNFDIASFMSRWLKTLAQDSQFEDGTFAHVSPKVNERGGSTAWGDAAIVCTHALYRTYGDARIVKDNYEPMLRYMAWLDTKTTNGIAKVGGFGDWVNLGDPTSPDLIDTAYRAELCRMMSEMAMVVGKSDDADRFAKAREATIAAFRARFLAADGSLKESGQTGYALAFTMGLIPEASREASAQHYSSAIEKKNWHLATGFIGTPRLLPGLAEAGQDAVAQRLLLNDDYPSWLYQVKLGATTMWERWDGWTPEQGFQDVGMNSFNHYAFGAVGDYLYGRLAGISSLEPGYRKILIAPRPQLDAFRTAKDLPWPAVKHVDATYDSPSGKIRSAWKSSGPSAMTYEITIPPNTTAEVRLPVRTAGMTGGMAATLTEAGRPLPAEGVTLVSGPSSQSPYFVLSVVSGSYRFVVKD